MKIALYPGHHALPFWHNPTQPRLLFDPVVMADWKVEVRDQEETKKKKQIVTKDISFKDYYLWPIMIGIHEIEMKLLAHVSLYLENGRMHGNKRMWVQITTMPKENDSQGIPLVLLGKERKVSCLWGWDNGTYTPWELERAKDVSEEEKRKPEFWRAFFANELRLSKSQATQKAEEALANARALKQNFDEVI